MQRLVLRPGREKSVRRRHPWLFSGAVAREEGDPGDGLAEVVSASGEVLGRGFACPGASLCARLWTFGPEPFDDEAIRSRLAAARRLRERVIAPETTGYRMLHSEGDFAPGLIADRYGATDVLLFTAPGAERQGERVARLYREVMSPGSLLLRTPDEAPQAAPLPFLEHGLRFTADPAGGQKTGFFLDQRENRRKARALSRGARVLNLFSYSGGFSVSALSGGAERAVDVDSSCAALERARLHRRENGFPAAEGDFLEADVFEDLRRRASAREEWDVVVCDPPAFARGAADVDRAARGYKDVLRLAMAVTAPGGVLLACSCSGHVTADLFQKILFAAALDAGRAFSIFEKSGAGPDHPVSLYCPESEYLKAFFLRRVE